MKDDGCSASGSRGGSTISLTVAEIIDLAEFAGCTIPRDELHMPDDMEAELTIAPCPAKGVLDEEDGSRSHYRHVAYFSDYPEEGCTGLGPDL